MLAEPGREIRLAKIDPARITSATPPTLNIGQTFTVTAQALDANNNIVAGAPTTATLLPSMRQ